MGTNVCSVDASHMHEQYPDNIEIYSECTKTTPKAPTKSRFIGWMAVKSVGSAGGTMIMWNSRSVKIFKSWRDVFSASVVVKGLSNKLKG